MPTVMGYRRKGKEEEFRKGIYLFQGEEEGIGGEDGGGERRRDGWFVSHGLDTNYL